MLRVLFHHRPQSPSDWRGADDALAVALTAGPRTLHNQSDSTMAAVALVFLLPLFLLLALFPLSLLRIHARVSASMMVFSSTAVDEYAEKR